MAKIFISYKYADNAVAQLPTHRAPTVRQYVDALIPYLEGYDHTFKGEENDEDLSHLSEERIAELLYDRIYDSTITVVLVSKNMVELGKSEKDQWIPTEISYSLTENNRGGRVSSTNAVLAVVLPDEFGSHSYFLQENACCTRWPMNATFGILKENMFNLRGANINACAHGEIHTAAEPSYIPVVKWTDFIGNINYHLQRALNTKQNIADYDVKKRIPD